VTSDAAIWLVPPAPQIPEALHGQPAVMIEGLYAGPAEQAEEPLRPLRELGTPLVDLSGTLTYTVLQSSLDALAPTGRRYYWKSLFLDELPDDAVDLLVDRASVAPSLLGPIVLRHLGGAMSRVPAEATAFGDRSAPYNLSVDAAWESAQDDERNIAWARDLWTEARRFASDRAYFNFAGAHEEGDELVRTTFGANYERLRRVKTAYDPSNLFRLNANIPPLALERRG
jgi:hypothetical protein